MESILLQATNKSAAHFALAPSASCITPFTFPNAVLEPLLVPTLPVRWENPVLLTAPFVENRTKLAAVPKLGACAKFTKEINSSIRAINTICSFLFIIIILECEWISTESKSRLVEIKNCYITLELNYIFHRFQAFQLSYTGLTLKPDLNKKTEAIEAASVYRNSGTFYFEVNFLE